MNAAAGWRAIVSMILLTAGVAAAWRSGVLLHDGEEVAAALWLIAALLIAAVMELRALRQQAEPVVESLDERFVRPDLSSAEIAAVTGRAARLDD